jgi:hypothetical protein
MHVKGEVQTFPHVPQLRLMSGSNEHSPQYGAKSKSTQFPKQHVSFNITLLQTEFTSQFPQNCGSVSRFTHLAPPTLRLGLQQTSPSAQ